MPGEFYRLDFFASTNNGPSINSFSVSWNGTTVTTLSPPLLGAWAGYSYDLLATSTITRLKFIGNIDGNNGAMVDAVSVSAIPEAASMPLFVFGALLMTAVVRRKISQQIDA